ncbi:hypothetical protein [Nesterenkonia sp. AN1]|uniref:hypothetical protein n=1 Tax=Nesterenkonia sp. AN1 TaxID=652017 RepID=UPI0012692B8A|nr:hypothetical protein [Nesterenkonia sp. AN1]
MTESTGALITGILLIVISLLLVTFRNKLVKRMNNSYSSLYPKLSKHEKSKFTPTMIVLASVAIAGFGAFLSIVVAN